MLKVSRFLQATKSLRFSSPPLWRLFYFIFDANVKPSRENSFKAFSMMQFGFASQRTAARPTIIAVLQTRIRFICTQIMSRERAAASKEEREPRRAKSFNDLKIYFLSPFASSLCAKPSREPSRVLCFSPCHECEKLPSTTEASRKSLHPHTSGTAQK
jgi:hypothetical protein